MDNDELRFENYQCPVCSGVMTTDNVEHNTFSDVYTLSCDCSGDTLVNTFTSNCLHRHH